MSPTGIPRRALSSPLTTLQSKTTTSDSTIATTTSISDGNDWSIDVSSSDLIAELPLIPDASISPRAALPEPNHITLTVSHAQSTYVTVIPLGNDWHSTSSNVPVEAQAATVYYTPYSSPTAMSIMYTPNPGTPRTAVTGIVVGCVLTLVLLIGVLWIYWLRLHQMKRRRSKSRRGSRKSSPAGSAAPPPPPPEEP